MHDAVCILYTAVTDFRYCLTQLSCLPVAYLSKMAFSLVSLKPLPLTNPAKPIKPRPIAVCTATNHRSSSSSWTYDHGQHALRLMAASSLALLLQSQVAEAKYKIIGNALKTDTNVLSCILFMR